MEMLWEYGKAFVVGGLICLVGQILIDKTKLTPARILVLFVTLGVVLTAVGLYGPLVDFAGAGATVPLTGFGYTMAKGVVKAIQEQGILGILTGGVTAAAAGIAAAVFLNADIKPGIEIVLRAVNLEQAVQGAALVITGEGRIDSQTAGGKAPLGVASVAKQFNVPVIGIAGVLGDGVEVVHQYGIDAVFSILPRLAPLAEVLASGETNLFISARYIACAFYIGQGFKN